MARARNIKPGFYKNEDLAECSVWARYIFPGLWMLADREGRLEDRPKRIKAELLAFDAQEVDPLLDELQARGFLVRYRNSDGSFIQISKFSTHQSPHYSEKASVIKPPGFQEDSEKHADILEGEIPGGLRESSESPTPIKRGSQPPDSLIPDSLIPEKNTVGLPPDADPPAKLNGHNRETRKHALAVLSFLNEKTGRNYQPVPANVDMIVARLKDGATVGDCRAVVAKKCREWGADEKMNEYLRPATLFNRTKFAQYVGEIAPEVEQ